MNACGYYNKVFNKQFNIQFASFDKMFDNGHEKMRFFFLSCDIVF